MTLGETRLLLFLRKELNQISNIMDRLLPLCKTCSSPIEKEWRKDKQTIRTKQLIYCCRECANSRGIRSNETKLKISSTLKKHSRYNKSEEDIQGQYTILSCTVCGNQFSHLKSKKKKTCSKVCRYYLYSINRQEYLKEHGNFATKRETFKYKNTVIETDSNLEKAGIVYLIDVLKATRIERFHNILNYWEGEAHRTYNPDFICVLEDGSSCIVEVKQPWSNKSNHSYNRTIPIKKVILERFCADKNMKMLWMDFNSCPQLKDIYKKILKDNKKSQFKS